MGDIADGILDGDFDEETGEYIGPGDGYPRSLAREARERKNKKPTTGDNAVKGVKNFLRGKKEEERFGLIVTDYSVDALLSNKSLTEVCEEIQKDFGKFVKWFKANYK